MKSSFYVLYMQHLALQNAQLLLIVIFVRVYVHREINDVYMCAHIIHSYACDIITTPGEYYMIYKEAW